MQLAPIGAACYPRGASQDLVRGRRQDMGNTPVTHETASEVASRFLRLYTGAISDILDKNGYRSQVLPYYITPFTTANRVAGMAFTGQGYPCADIAHDDTGMRLKVLDRISPGTVSVDRNS